MIKKKCMAMLAIVIWCQPGYAEHRPLLPRPQQIRYGNGQVELRDAQIVFGMAPEAADLFTAAQLERWIREQTGLSLTIVSYGNRGGGKLSIVFDREGPKDEPLPRPGEQPGPNSREAFDLSVTEQGVKIHARSSAGIFWGAQTLRQLMEGEGAQAVLPVVEIHDWPAMAYRGTMVDISHGPLPRESEIERQLDFLARWKANQYYLYSEDSIELEGYPLLNVRARLTKEEVRRIVAYGRERHIDVIPNFDLFGHQHDFFRIEEYSEMSDEPHGTEFDARNPKVMPLMTDWANQFAELFPSPFVSIGFDETFQIEMATRAQAANNEPAELFVKQLTAVAGLFEKHGKHVMAWDDIVVKYPQVIPKLPPDLIAVAWYYTSEDPTYKRWLAPLISHRIPHFVQPGLTSYDDIAPDFDTSFENIDTFLAAGRRSGAWGLINSVWADDAQLLMRMSWPGMAYGAAAPWQSDPINRTNFFSDYARLMYPAAVAADLASALSDMTIAQTDAKKLLGDQSMFALWEDPFFPTYYKKLAGHQQDLHETRMHAEQAETALFHAKSLGADPATINSLLIGSELLDYAGEKFQTPLDLGAIWAKVGPKRPDPERWWNEWESQVTHYDHSYVIDLMDRITDLKPAYRSEWLEEYAPYRLGAALGRWDAEYQYWRGVHEKLRHFNDSTQAGDPLPPLDQVIESPTASRGSGQ
ncbi:MAG: beta-N-acetylhexosaminidase [Acidobacteria bacterium]|nr:beta-N-acetylhexosaminidase [Acidobacteriota bacterium]